MVQASQPINKDTAPAEYVKMARDWLYDANLPAEWEDSVAREFSAAIGDRKLELLYTYEQGRPYDTPLVEWEHRELDKRPQQAAEMRAEEAKALAEQEGLADQDEAAQEAQQFYDATHHDEEGMGAEMAR